MLRLPWRFFTGNHLDGKRRTNATWKKQGTLPKQQLTWWSAMPRLKRMAWRNAIFWSLTLVGLGLWRFPGFTIWAVSAMVPYTFTRLVPRVMRRFTRRVRVRPRLSEIEIPVLDEDDLADQESAIGEIAAASPIDVEAIPIRKPRNRRQAK